MRPNSVAYPRILSLPIAIPGIAYLVGYVLLDWVSFIEPYVFCACRLKLCCNLPPSLAH